MPTVPDTPPDWWRKVGQMSGINQPLVETAAGGTEVVEGKRWVVLLIFSWIEFNQVRGTVALSARRAAVHASIALHCQPACVLPYMFPSHCAVSTRCLWC